MKKTILYKLITAIFFSVSLVISSFLPGSALCQETVFHSLDVRINLKDRKMDGVDTIRLKGYMRELRLVLRDDSRVEKITSSGKTLRFTDRKIGGSGLKEIRFHVPENNGEDPVIKVHFSGSFPSVEKAAEEVKRGVSMVSEAVMGGQGALLLSSSNWYPAQEGSLTPFEATVTVPPGYTSVMAGERTHHEKKAEATVSTWRCDKPLDGLDLVISKFHEKSENYKGIRLYTFFLEGDTALSKTYIEKTKGYLDLYQDLFGPYPFAKFAVVENFLPTGYGMPSFTLLGSTVLRLPFIPDTSLGHEIAHNWWGNSVYVDPLGGNWAEAITTYGADYLFARRKGAAEARAFRLNKLRGYKNFAGDISLSLRDFHNTTDPGPRAVGYDKGFMAFSMLEDTLGEDVFRKGMNRLYADGAFRKVGWEDIRKAFEKESGRDLSWFFNQWVSRPGGPMLKIKSAGYSKAEKGYRVELTLEQKEDYSLTLPLSIRTEDGVETRKLEINGKTARAFFDVASKPASVEIDPDYRVFRIFSDMEMPPLLSSSLGDRMGVIIMPSGDARDKYAGAANLLSRDYDVKVVADASLHGKLPEGNLLIMGGPGENKAWDFIKDLPDSVKIEADAANIYGRHVDIRQSEAAFSFKPVGDPSKTISVLAASGPDEAASAARRMEHYLDTSYIIFKKAGRPEKGVVDTPNALRREF